MLALNYNSSTKATSWAELRNQSIALIQQMNTDLVQWSDYNISDPGITLLETLCYAISDLNYRLDFPIQDLLAPGPNIDSTQQQQFFPATDSLPNAPLTLNDYRRLLIDFEGINNAWLHPLANQGEYQVFVDVADAKSTAIDKIKEDIVNILNQQRNLAEGFTDVNILSRTAVEVSLVLTLADNAEKQQVQQQVQQSLVLFFSQSLATYDFEQMLAMGYSVADILQGYIPASGFIPESELQRTSATFNKYFNGVPEFHFYAHDLERALQKIPGVQGVSIQSWSDEISEPLAASQPLVCTETPYFVSAWLQFEQYGINFEPELVTGTVRNTQSIATDIHLDYPQGQYRHLANYSSIQDELPAYYGVGKSGLGNNASTLRQEQAKQLRAYLILFDQILCNYFAQLEHASELLVMQRDIQGQPSNPLSPENQAYFAQQLPYTAWEQDFPDMYQCLAQQQDHQVWFDANIKQKNKLLDHLLALFSESYMPEEIYYQIRGITTPASNDARNGFLLAKQSYLNQVVPLRARRGQEEGLQSILALKLGLERDEVEIQENVDEREWPIPQNEIPFLIAGETAKPNFTIQISLPEKFVQQGDNKATPVQEYTNQTLLAQVPAHLRFELRVKA